MSDDPEVDCYFDGACPGNQFESKGAMLAAFAVGSEEHILEIPDLKTRKGPVRSNNVAEYQALILLLKRLKEVHKARGGRGSYRINGDSQLVVRQMEGRYRVKEAHLVPLHREAAKIAKALPVSFRWIPREENRAGHLLE